MCQVGRHASLINISFENIDLYVKIINHCLKDIPQPLILPIAAEKSVSVLRDSFPMLHVCTNGRVST